MEKMHRGEGAGQQHQSRHPPTELMAEIWRKLTSWGEGSLIPLFTGVLYIPGGWEWDFWTINSSIHAAHEFLDVCFEVLPLFDQYDVLGLIQIDRSMKYRQPWPLMEFPCTTPVPDKKIRYKKKKKQLNLHPNSSQENWHLVNRLHCFTVQNTSSASITGKEYHSILSATNPCNFHLADPKGCASEQI